MQWQLELKMTVTTLYHEHTSVSMITHYFVLFIPILEKICPHLVSAACKDLKRKQQQQQQHFPQKRIEEYSMLYNKYTKAT